MTQLIYLTSDFSYLGSRYQIRKEINRLIESGKLIRISKGVYVRGIKSKLTGEIIPELPLPILARKVLERLGIQIVPFKLEADYNSGVTTQVPTGRLIGITKPSKRKITWDGVIIEFELVKNYDT